MPTNPEAFSRILIDRTLTESDWDLLNPRQARFETHAGGRTDYVLLDDKEMVLCMLEAKREDLDPYDAKEQARGYAENLRAFRPDLTLRRYQINALEVVAQQIGGEGRHKFLLEMTTGKTLLCAALIRRFIVTRNAECVLFISNHAVEA